MSKKANLLWMDLEMTGLNPETCKIIEVGVIATSWDLEEVATYEQIVQQDQITLDTADDWVKQNMQDLLSQVPNGTNQRKVEQDLLTFVETYFDLEQPIYIAGNSIHQDKRFLRRAWPELDKKLHYRMLDVSAWKVVMSHKFGVEFKKREQHRALDDIRGSIEELQLYLDKVNSSN